MNKDYYLALYKLLKHYQKAYEENQPLISDEHYDVLYAEFKKLEEQFGQIAEDAPTQIVGYKDRNREYVTHLKPMLSLEHELGVEGLDIFVTKINRFLNTNKFYTLIAQPKIDGVSVAIRYKNGVLQTAALRGDGVEGEDITANVIAMNIPNKLSLFHYQDFEIRGELYMPLSIYESEFSEEFASARHAVSGAVRLLDTVEFKRRKIGLLVHGFAMNKVLNDQQEFSEIIDEKHTNYFEIMKEIGKSLQIVPEMICNDQESAEKAFKYWVDMREKQDFLMDGVVYKINDMNLWQTLQYSAKSPRYAFALKFQGAKAVGDVEKVEWSVGRTGVITPVLEIKPVELDGVTISKITLHNASEYLRWNVVKGDKALIERAFDVIPAVVEVVNLSEEKAVLPTSCPSCGSELVLDDKFLICKNSWNCPEQVVDRLFHLLSRDAFDIEGLGLQKLAYLYENKLLHYPADIFLLKENCEKAGFDLMSQEGWGQKSVEKLFNNIQTKKQVTFAKFLYALGIEGVGKSLAAKISLHCDNWQDFIKFAQIELIELDGVGEIIAQNIKMFILQESYWVEELLNCIEILPSVKNDRANIFVVFTGTFKLSRQAMKQSVAKYPYIVIGDSVSKKTNILAFGADAGSKLKKAQSLGIKCLNEEEWNEFVRKLD